MENFNIKNVKICWSKIKLARGSEFFVKKFYQIMFEQYPETRALFPKSMKLQNAALLGMLDSVINGIEFINELKESLVLLGERHKGYGIKDEMYDVFVDIVVEAAIESSSNTITDTELADWKHAFRSVSDIMIQGN